AVERYRLRAHLPCCVRGLRVGPTRAATGSASRPQFLGQARVCEGSWCDVLGRRRRRVLARLELRIRRRRRRRTIGNGRMRLARAVSAATFAVALVAGVLVPASIATAAPGASYPAAVELSEVGDRAILDLRRCLESRDSLDVLYLIDESGSLLETDP